MSETSMKTILYLLASIYAGLASASALGLSYTTQLKTPPVAVMMETLNSDTEAEAKLKSKAMAEAIAKTFPDISDSRREGGPYSEIVRSATNDCRNSANLQLEGQKITYDLYTNLIDGITYVQAILTFKYTCPELNRRNR